ncbi:MAG: tetratricopeptide repeat-containing sensor histidine kinase [Candidatus Kapabacteria bacterium]|nr:tetratricopeptide repeat-containing sensor histidine kinase [Candidatus Kapabacteria bacterium]
MNPPHLQQRPVVSASQDISVLDSLEMLLPRVQERERVALHNLLSFEFYYISLEKARYHQGSALQLARKYSDSLGIAEAYLNEGFIARLEGDYQHASEASMRALHIFQSRSNVSRVSRALYNLGLATSSKNEYVQARSYLLQSLDYAEQSKDSFQLARTLNAISEEYFAIGEPAKALQYAQQSLAIHRMIPDKRWLALQIDNVGFLYENMKQSATALQYYQEGYAILRALGNKGRHRLANSCKNIANALRQLGRTDEALVWARKGAELQETSPEMYKSLNGLRGNYRAIAEIFEARNNLDSALVWYDRILALPTQKNFYTLIVFEKIARLHAEKGNKRQTMFFADKSWNLALQLNNPRAREIAARTKAFALRFAGKNDSAYIFLTNYVTIHDSLNSLEKKTQLERLQAAHDSEKRNAENERLRQENLVKEAVIARQTFAVIAVSVTLIATFALTLLIFRANKRNKQTSMRLQAINSELDSTIQELHQTQSQLVLADRVNAVGMLTAGVMHEINNPNAAVYGALESLQTTNKDIRGFFLALLDEESKQSPEAQEFVRLSDRASSMITVALLGSERVKHIVASLRTFTKHQEAGFKKTALLQELQATTEIFRYQFKDVRVELDCPQELTIVGNIAEINQVFLNLLVNAAQAAATVITIRCRSLEGGAVEIDVIDNGNGMESRIISRIFEPFFSTKESEGDGSNSGLGLSITQQILERHSASIRVESEPGKGTTFTLCFAAPNHAAQEFSRELAPIS